MGLTALQTTMGTDEISPQSRSVPTEYPSAKLVGQTRHATEAWLAKVSSSGGGKKTKCANSEL